MLLQPHLCLQAYPHFPHYTNTSNNTVAMPDLHASGIKKLACRVCHKAFSKAEHLRVRIPHTPTVGKMLTLA